MAGPTLEEMDKHLFGMQDRLHKMHGSAEALSESFTSIANVLPKLLVLEGAHAAIKAMGSRLKDWAVALTSSEKVREKHDASVLAFVEKLQKAGHTEVDIERQRLDFERRAAPMYQARLGVAHAFENTSQLALKYLGLSAALIANSVRQSGALNDALIKSNSLLSERYRLNALNYSISVRTGQSFSDVLETQKALVNAGLATNKNYSQIVETVTMLHGGLGLSVETATQLAVVVSNQVRGSFEKVSDLLANIVNQTSLTADEAARMAKELGTTLSMTRGQAAGGLLPEMTKAVARYEDALKRMGGASGAFTKLVEKASGPQGFGMAGMLGIQSPEMLTARGGIDTLMRNFKRLGDTMVGESQGWQRRMGLEALANIMGTSADEVNTMYLSLKNLNPAITDEINLRERYLQQTRDFGHSVSQLLTRLASLIERGLYPFVVLLNALFSALNRMIDGLVRIKYVPEILTTIAVTAIPLAVIALGSLIKAIYQLGVSALAAKLGVEAESVGLGSILRKLVGVEAGAGVGLSLKTGLVNGLKVLFAPLLTMAGAIVATLGAMFAVSKMTYDIMDDTRNKARASRQDYGRSLDETAYGYLERAGLELGGSVAANAALVEQAYTNLRQSQRANGIYGEAAAAQIKEAEEYLYRLQQRVIIGRHQFSGVELTSAEKAQQANEEATMAAAKLIGDKFIKSATDEGAKDRQAVTKRQTDEDLRWYSTILTADWLSGSNGIMLGRTGRSYPQGWR